jgi:hypothetical protein
MLPIADDQREWPRSLLVRATARRRVATAVGGAEHGRGEAAFHGGRGLDGIEDFADLWLEMWARGAGHACLSPRRLRGAAGRSRGQRRGGGLRS